MKTHALRYRIFAIVAVTALLVPAAVPAHAVSKEMVQLQTQVQQLLDMVQRLQSTVDTKFAVMQNLAQQTADQAAQMTTAVNALQQKLNAQDQAESGKVDTVSGQVQSLNDSVDELKSRIAKLDKSIQDLQAQMQQMQAQPNPATAPGAAPGAMPGPVPGGAMPGAAPNAGNAAPGTGAPSGGQAATAPGAAPAPQSPPLQETFQAGLRDFNAGRLQLASSEFRDVVHYYPLDDLAGTSQFYLGEISYQQQHYDQAVNDYNAVLEGFAGNAKAPAAQLHKGYALLALDKKQAGIQELRELIKRHPQTPEAARARSKLNGMGIRISASR